MKILFFLMTGFLLSLNSGDIPKKIISNHSLTMATQPSPESPDIKVIKVTLLAREEKTPPIGEPSAPDRDIGFASVFVRLANLKESDSKITIENITIMNLFDAQSQNFNFSSKEIILHPLENSEQVFHLRNKTGYLGKEPVKAIVTYRIGDLIREINSDSTEVQRP
jgi:hypothetical protein